MPAPQGLDGGAVVALDVAHPGEQGRQQVGAQPLAQRRREVGHLRDVVTGEVVPAELLGAKGLLAERRDRLAPPGRVEVGEVARRQAALGGVENERESSHGGSSVRAGADLPPPSRPTFATSPDGPAGWPGLPMSRAHAWSLWGGHRGHS